MGRMRFPARERMRENISSCNMSVCVRAVLNKLMKSSNSAVIGFLMIDK